MWTSSDSDRRGVVEPIDEHPASRARMARDVDVRSYIGQSGGHAGEAPSDLRVLNGRRSGRTGRGTIEVGWGQEGVSTSPFRLVAREDAHCARPVLPEGPAGGDWG